MVKISKAQILDALDKDQYIELVHLSFFIKHHRDEFITLLQSVLADIDNADYLSKRDKSHKSQLKYLIRLNTNML